jgi:hypothetical protein
MAKCKQCGCDIESDFNYIRCADVSFKVKKQDDDVNVVTRWGILEWDDKSVFCSPECFGEYVKDNVEKIVKQVKGEDDMAKYRASPKSTKIKNGCTRTKRSSGCIGSAIARQNARRRAK